MVPREKQHYHTIALGKITIVEVWHSAFETVLDSTVLIVLCYSYSYSTVLLGHCF